MGIIPEQLDPRAEQALTDALRAMTPAQRIGQIGAMWRWAWNMILAQLRTLLRGRSLRARMATLASPGTQFYREGGLDKHISDIRGILRVSGPQLDYDYLDRWAVRLGVQDEWRVARSTR